MFKAVIAGYSRSPFTMARKGALIDVKPVNMLAEVVKNLVAKSNINNMTCLRYSGLICIICYLSRGWLHIFIVRNRNIYKVTR